MSNGGRCHVCDGEGHIGRDCPSVPRADGKASGDPCYGCNGKGHQKKDCPTASPHVKGGGKQGKGGRWQQGGWQGGDICADEGAEHGDREVMLRGPPKQIAAVKVLIEQAVEDMEKLEESKASDITDTFTIPNFVVAAVIGKGGQMIQQIKQDSGAVVMIHDRCVSVAAQNDERAHHGLLVHPQPDPQAHFHPKRVFAPP